MTRTPAFPRPTPRRLIAGGAALGLATLLAVVVLLPSGKTADDVADVAENPATTAAPLEAEIPGEDTSEDNTRLQALASRLADQQDRIEDLAHALDQLTALMEQRWALLDQIGLSERLEQLQRTAEVVTDMRLELDEQQAVTRRLDDLQAQIMGLQRTVRAVEARRERDQNPPFSVVALEVWDGAAQAVVLANGETLTLEAGQTLDAWSLIEVDPQARMTHWRAPGGRDVALQVRR